MAALYCTRYGTTTTCATGVLLQAWGEGETKREHMPEKC